MAGSGTQVKRWSGHDRSALSFCQNLEACSHSVKLLEDGRSRQQPRRDPGFNGLAVGYEDFLGGASVSKALP